MKNERITASLDRVTLPEARADALLFRILREAEAMRAAAEKEETMNNEKRPAKSRSERKRRALRILVSAAAVLLVLAALFSIPGVAKAITGWVNDFFRTERYMSEGRGADAADPDMEEAVLHIEPEAQSYEILLLSEIPAAKNYNYEEIDAWRVKLGQPAFAEADWAWIRDIVPRVDRVLYDGRHLIVKTFYETDPVPFTRGYLTGISEGERACDILCLDCTLKVNGETIPCGGYGHGLDFSKWYDKRDEPGFSIEDVRADGGVYGEVNIDFDATPGLPDGICEAEFVMTVQDAQTDDMGIVGMVAQIIHRFRFDTTAGNAQISSSALAQCAFTGDAVVTVYHYGDLLENPADSDETKAYDQRGNRIEPDGEQWIENRAVTLDGFSVAPVVNRRSTGIHVELPYTYPADWDYDTQTAVMAAVGYELIVDGVTQNEVHCMGPLSAPSIEISITPTELAEVKSIVLRPYIRRVSLWGDVPMVTGVRMELPHDSEIPFEWTDMPLPGCEIAIAVPAE